MQGDKLKIVVAYKDRLARFGFELIESIINKNGGKIVVLDRIELSPEQELTKDILQILHVFSCRINGMRKYHNQIKEDKNIP
jgi:predicted site-specific integrase-resolvase